MMEGPMENAFTSAQISAMAGPVAFVLTAANLVLGLQFYFRIIVLGNTPGKNLLAFFIGTTAIAYSAWLIHLWPLENMYVRIALGLELIGAVVLLLQVIYIACTNTKNHK